MIISDTFGGVCAAAAAVINQAVAEHWLLTSIFVVAAALQLQVTGGHLTPIIARIH